MLTKQEQKDAEEWNYFRGFIRTPSGKSWLRDNKIIESFVQKTENPDFLLDSGDGQKIGLELTRLDTPNENTQATQHLLSTGNKVLHHIEKTYGIQISIIINKVNKMHFVRTREEYLEAAYHPGFSYIQNKKDFKSALIKSLEKNIKQLKNHQIVYDWIGNEVKEMFKITAEMYPNPFTGKYDVSVNNVQLSIPNPFEKLKDAINKKSKNYDRYLNNCQKCFLLVISPDPSKGSCCHFDSALNKHKFYSKYSDVYLYEERKCQSIKLKNLLIKS